MHKRLSQLESAAELHGMSISQLQELGVEIREVLCNLLSDRSAHFASNLGVVELCLALHSVFDFRRDRLIWDTGHQIYPHKLVTGRKDNLNPNVTFHQISITLPKVQVLIESLKPILSIGIAYTCLTV